MGQLGNALRSIFVLSAIWLTVTLANPVQAQDFPALSGRVVDQADLLSPAEEEALDTKLKALETQSNRQLVVTTISDLQGYEISDYGYRLGRHWSIGQGADGEAEKDNGILLIIAPNERKMRIEVGYGLEPVLTDALSSRIIRNDITPKFKASDYPGGINAGVDKIITQLQLPPDEAAKIAAKASSKSRSDDGGINVGSIIFWLFVFFFVILPMFSAGRRDGKRHRRSGSVGPVVIWGGGGGWGGGSSGGSSWGGGGFSGGGGGFGGGGASGGW